MDQSERKEKHPSLPPDYVSLAQLRERWLQKQQDQSERKEKERPSLPPDYVSLAQLRDRWLQKQREKEMSEKREKEMSDTREMEMSKKREKDMSEKHEEDSKKQQRGAGLNANQNQRDWRENEASFGDKGKGKEIVIDGFENKKSEYYKKTKKKKKKKESRRRKFENGIQIAKEKFESDSNKEFNGGIEGFLSGENSGNGGLKGPAKEMVNRIDSSRKTKFEKGIEVAKEKLESETNREFNGGIMEPNGEITDPRSGHLRNGDYRVSGYSNRNRKFKKGIEVAKEKLASETNKEFNGGVKGALSMKNSGNDRLKGPSEEIVNIINSRSGFSRNGDNRVSGYSSRNRKFEKGIEVAKEKLESETNKEFSGGVKEVLSVENSGNDWLKGPNEEIVNIIDSRSGFSRNGDNRGSGYYSRNKKFEKGVEAAKEMLESETNKGLNGRIKFFFSGESSGNDGLKGPTEGFSRNGSYRETGDNRKREDSNRVRVDQLKLTEVNLASEKKMEDKRGHSRTWREIRRNGNNRGGEGHYRLKENGHYVSKADVVEPKLEKKADNENLEVYSEIGGLNGGDRNGLSSDDHNRVEGEGLNENGSTADKKADEMVLALESVGICEKEGVGDGYRRHRNNGRRFRGGDWKSNVADLGQYARPGRFEGHWKMKGRDNSGMMWVKKEDKTGAYDDA